MASWQQSYDRAKPTYTRVNDKKFADLEAGTTVLIPNPADIEAEIRAFRPSEEASFALLRERLADRHNADGTCPVMCGMNLRVVAEVIFEALDAGVPTEDVTPVWNVIDPKSNLATKLPGGPSRVQALRDRTASTE